MTPPSLLHRIRWANVARAAAVLGSLALVIAWPHLGPRAPQPPPSAVIEPAPSAPQATSPVPPAAEPGAADAVAPAKDPAAPRGGRSGDQSAASAPSRAKRRSHETRRDQSGGQASASAPSRKRAVTAPPAATTPPRASRVAPASAVAPPTAAPAPRRQTQQEFGPAPSEFPRKR